MTYKIDDLGTRMRARRNDNYKRDPENFNYCKTQELLSEKIMSSKSNAPIDRRTVINWENGNSTPNLQQLIQLCECLDCDADYLLGKSESPLKATNEISKYLGISEENIETIKRNKLIQEILNYFLSSGELKKMTEEINNISLISHISGDLLSHYSEQFKAKIRYSYMSSQTNTYALDERGKNFKQNLKREFPYKGKNIGTLRQYLQYNIDKDVFDQILALSEFDKNHNEKNLYSVFIDTIADFTFEPLMNIQINDFKIHNMSQAFLDSLIRFINSTVEKRRNLLKEVALLKARR